VARHASHFWPYIAALPVAIPTASHLSASEQHLLWGTTAHADAVAAASQLEREYVAHMAPLTGTRMNPGAFPDGLLTGDEGRRQWRWAYSVLTSRSFKSGPGGGGLSLVPILDMANHAPRPHLRYRDRFTRRDDSGGGRTLIFTPKAQAAGEEWWNDYGAVPNAKLALDYGFVIGGGANADDYYGLAIPALPVAAAAEARAVHMAMLEAAGFKRTAAEVASAVNPSGNSLPAATSPARATGACSDSSESGPEIYAPVRLFGAGLSKDLLRVLRVATLSVDEVEAEAAKVAKAATAVAAGTQRVSVRNERSAMHLLLAQCAGHLRRMKANLRRSETADAAVPVEPANGTASLLHEERRALPGAVTEAGRAALSLRVEQRALLERNVHLAGRWLGALPADEGTKER
jgi:hypothetical protein